MSASPRRRLWTFVAGMLVGVVLGGLVGGGGAVAMLLAHPHFASRLRDAFFPPAGSSISTIRAGSLNGLVIRVDTSAAGTHISPYIYGVSQADEATVKALGATLDRWGGNQTSTYNWANGHAWNAARDWEFRNGNYGVQSGSAVNDFIQGALGAGAIPLVTVPSLGWVAKNDNNNTQSTGVPAQGGPPIAPGSQAIAGYDPTANRNNTMVPSFATKPGSFTLTPSPTEAAVYQDEWVHELVQRFGPAPGGVRYFTIDNEPDLWSVTHTDVHPVRMSYADMLQNYEQYAVAVKAQDPTALLLGPDVSGWTFYWFSGLDQGSDNFATHADQAAHGGTPFLQWWLGQVAKADAARGSRSLDLLDVHYYPQASNVYSDAADPATQALRIRSVRSLYDPNYVDESWIATPVQLIPRLKQWIAKEYPGTGLAITEYNWGGQKDASGGVALAEVLGIYGRAGVSLATYWAYPPIDSPAGAAFRLYRNFDGKGATFGDISLPVSGGVNGLMAFASKHSDRNEYDVVLVNESPDQVATVRLNLGLSGTAVATQFAVTGSSIVASAPFDPNRPVEVAPYSMSLVRVVVQ